MRPPSSASQSCQAAPQVSSSVQPAVTPQTQRKYPDQTCEDERREELQAQKNAACNVPRSCKDQSLDCDEILQRIEQNKACLAARQQMRDECFGGVGDQIHDDQIQACRTSWTGASREHRRTIVYSLAKSGEVMTSMDDNQIRMQLTEQIERAFADVLYPGDDRIVANPSDLESSMLRDRFKGKHWSTLSLKTLMDERSGLPLLTPEAFRFFLPAYLHVSVVRPNEVDVIPENVVSRLTPPAQEGESAEWFRAVVSGFTPGQKQVIRAFMRYWFDQIPQKYLIDSDRRAKNFWLESGLAFR
jgi:hypothetical protein